MNHIDPISTNHLIAILRAMTHEASRVNLRLDAPDLDDELAEELAEYAQDLAGATGVLGQAYEERRNAEPAGQELATLAGLLNHFANENVL